MSKPHEPQPAKLFVGLLFHELSIQRRVLNALTAKFGAVDFLTEPKPFTHTTYYDAEMGPSLRRQVGSFAELVHPERLADIKLFTNGLETQFSQEHRRKINIDPGLLSEERLILGTGKNYTHRIYLRGGIYADLTLIYQKGKYRGLPWTYPDYREPDVIHFLGVLRQKLIFQRTNRLPRKVRVEGVVI